MLVPGPDPYDESWMLGTIFSAMTYGIVLTLSFCCIQLLWANPKAQSRRLRWFLFAYILAMTVLSTTSMAAAINSIVDAVFKVHEGRRLPQPTLPVKTWGSPFIILATWGADSFMLWRCNVLYQAISKARRIAFLALLGCLATLSLCSGVLFLVLPFDKGWLLLIFVAVTALINIIVAVLIVARLSAHQRYIRQVLGTSHGASYTKVMAMCVESSLLIVVFNIAYLILDFEEFLGTVILINLLVHIYAISPFLIIYRVAQGRSASTIVPSDFLAADLQDIEQVSSPRNHLRFDTSSNIDSIDRHSLNQEFTESVSARTSTLPNFPSIQRAIP